MTQYLKQLFSGLLLMIVLFALTGCGYNNLQSADEQVKANWSEVLNQYQRRADLVPQLVKAVDAYMTQERQVLTQVTEARAKVGTIQLTADALENPQAIARFQQAQGELSSALSHLLAVSENYPQLRSDSLFRDLQAQLEGTENRIAVARGRYVQSVRAFNVLTRQFPTLITARIFGYRSKANFGVENEAAIAKPPEIHFSNQQQANAPTTNTSVAP